MNEKPRTGSLLVIFLTVFIDLLGFGIVLPLLPIYADTFAEDPAGWRLGALMASFSLMQFLFAPFWGRLSDHIGRRPVLLVGLAGSVAFYALFGVATEVKSLTLLFVSRIGAGIAGATIPTAQAYIADTTTLEARSKGMALIGMAFGLGFTFGPLLGFAAVPSGQGDPGPWPGYVAAALSAAAWLLACFQLPESRRAETRPGRWRVLDWTGFRAAMQRPSIALLLAAIFVCLFSFAKFETTLSLLVKGADEAGGSPFRFSWGGVCLTYAFIGLLSALVQGGLVRRLAGRVSETALATGGALLEVAGYGLIVWAIGRASGVGLFAALALVVTGFSMMQPSLHSLLSRRSDPGRQGAILGVGQSVGSLARILGAGLGIPLLRYFLELPFCLAAALMVVGLVLVLAAARRGRDFAPHAGSPR